MIALMIIRKNKIKERHFLERFYLKKSKKATCEQPLRAQYYVPETQR